MSSLTLSLLAGYAGAAQPSATEAPGVPRSGIDLQYIDPGVRAQDDFFSHMNG